MRVFLAIPIGDAVNAALDDWLASVSLRSALRLVPSYNRHVTMQFFGDVSDEESALLQNAVQTFVTDHPLVQDGLEAGGIGLFHMPQDSRILWAGVLERDGWLSEYRTSLCQLLEREGFKKESREWRPHITLARIRGMSRIDLTAFCSSSEPVRFGAILPVQLVLYRSTLLPDGPKYDILRRF